MADLLLAHFFFAHPDLSFGSVPGCIKQLRQSRGI